MKWAMGNTFLGQQMIHGTFVISYWSWNQFENGTKVDILHHLFCYFAAFFPISALSHSKKRKKNDPVHHNLLLSWVEVKMVQGRRFYNPFPQECRQPSLLTKAHGSQQSIITEWVGRCACARVQYPQMPVNKTPKLLF